jgi:hypothetical protein
MAKHTAGRKLSTALLLFSPLVLLPYFGCWHAALVQFVQPAILERVTPPRNLNAGKTKYFQVKPKTPIIDVPEIKGHSVPHLLHLGCLSPEAVHLRPPRHPSRGSPFRL